MDGNISAVGRQPYGQMLKGKIVKNEIEELKAGFPITYTKPYLLKPTQSSIYICWLSSVKTSRSYVEYGTSPSYGKAVTADTYEIEGLKLPDSEGNYTVKLYRNRSRLQAIASATCLVCIPEGAESLDIGETVPVQILVPRLEDLRAG